MVATPRHPDGKGRPRDRVDLLFPRLRTERAPTTILILDPFPHLQVRHTFYGTSGSVTNGLPDRYPFPVITTSAYLHPRKGPKR